MIGRACTRAATVATHVCTQLVISAAVSPFVCSTSSTGRRSIGCGWATDRKWVASAAAFFLMWAAVPSEGSAKS